MKNKAFLIAALVACLGVPAWIARAAYIPGGGAITVADGADVSQGAKADTVCGTATGTCSGIALQKFIASQMTSAIPVITAGSATSVVGCASSISYDASTNGKTQLVALSSGQTIRVCGFSILSAGTSNVSLVSGTGTACATGTAAITPAWQLTAQVGIVDGSPFYRGLNAGASNALCISTNAAVAVQAIVYYTQY